MWLLRRKAPTPKTKAEVLSPAKGPMRRIEITVERRSVTRFSQSSGAAPAEPTEPHPRLPSPPDG